LRVEWGKTKRARGGAIPGTVYGRKKSCLGTTLGCWNWGGGGVSKIHVETKLVEYGFHRSTQNAKGERKDKYN